MQRLSQHHRPLSLAGIERARVSWRPTALASAGVCTVAPTAHHGDQVADGEVTLHRIVQATIGQRLHRLIAELADIEDPDVDAAVVELVAAEPVPTAVGASVRLQLASLVRVYLARFRPECAQLVGTEVPLEGCRADLVWRHVDGRVAIDEAKTAAGRSTKPSAQVRRLARSGAERWGLDFVGVRRCVLDRPSATTFFVAAGDCVRPVAAPGWLEVR